MTFRWKDRSRGGRVRQSTIDGVEFVTRYLRHVLPRGLRSVRYFGFCHPTAKRTCERIAFHSGRTLKIGSPEFESLTARSSEAANLSGVVRKCPCCGEAMERNSKIVRYTTIATRAPP